MAFKRFTPKNILVVSILSVLYVLWAYYLIGMRPEHLPILGLIIFFWYYSENTRKNLLSFMPFLIYVTIYDSLRIYPNYKFNPVHIIEPYNLEKALFGIKSAIGTITPNEYFLGTDNAFLDVVCGVFYLSWVPVPLAFGFYLMFKDKPSFLRFIIAFLLVNIIGFIIYYAYPAAPPWYYAKYGVQENFNILGDCAGLIRFDQFFNIRLFQDMYEKSSNVFAAIPSLHSAYPVIVLFYAMKRKMKMSIVFLILTLGIWFTAIYTSHHYIIDVIIGAACAALAIFIFEKVLMRAETPFRRFFDRYLDRVI